jgi:hypothetical protein
LSTFLNLDVAQGHVILDETIELLCLSSEQQHPTSPTVFKLKGLLEKYFQDDVTGQLFRSMIIYGKPDGAVVSLDYFNKSALRPWSSNMFELQPNHIYRRQ